VNGPNAVAMHLVEALAHTGQAQSNIGEARRALAQLVGAGVDEVWGELDRLESRLATIQTAIRAVGVSSQVRLDPAHTGVGCSSCAPAHGLRRWA